MKEIEWIHLRIKTIGESLWITEFCKSCSLLISLSTLLPLRDYFDNFDTFIQFSYIMHILWYSHIILLTLYFTDIMEPIFNCTYNSQLRAKPTRKLLASRPLVCSRSQESSMEFKETYGQDIESPSHYWLTSLVLPLQIRSHSNSSWCQVTSKPYLDVCLKLIDYTIYYNKFILYKMC